MLCDEIACCWGIDWKAPMVTFYDYRTTLNFG